MSFQLPRMKQISFTETTAFRALIAISAGIVVVLLSMTINSIRLLFTHIQCTQLLVWTALFCLLMMHACTRARAVLLLHVHAWRWLLLSCARCWPCLRPSARVVLLCMYDAGVTSYQKVFVQGQKSKFQKIKRKIKHKLTRRYKSALLYLSECTCNRIPLVPPSTPQC